MKARACLAAMLYAPLLAAAAPLAADTFAWRASLEAPAGAALARIDLPAQAIAASRSAVLADLRVVDGQGNLVPFTIRRPVAAAPQPAASPLTLYPLSRTPPPGQQRASRLPSMQVHVAGADGAVWVQVPGAPAAATALPSVLLDLREQVTPLAGLRLDADLPANTPVRLHAFASADLVEWRELPVRGALYRFAGPPAIENQDLAFAAPQALRGQYVRLDWDADRGVQVRAAAALATAQAVPQRVVLSLPDPAPVSGGLEWSLPSVVAPAALELMAEQANSLVPVRVLVRREASQPWRLVAQTVVFHLADASNAPVPLGVAAPLLRMEPVQPLPLGRVSARLHFDPVQVVFLAAPGPLQLLVGQAGAMSAAVAEDQLGVALKGTTWDALPAARLGAATQVPPSPSRASWFPAWVPQSVTTASLALWSVLLLGVLVLGVVAWRLMGQLQATKA